MEFDFIEVEGEKIYFSIQRKKIKNMNLRVNRDKSVTLSIPIKMSIEKAKKFVTLKVNWIKKQQKFYDAYENPKENLNFEKNGIACLLGKQYKIQTIKNIKNDIEIIDNSIQIHIKEKYAENDEYIRKIYYKWLKSYALGILTKIVSKYQSKVEKYNIPMPKIEIKQMKSTWGICRPKEKKVTFNINLIKAPIECIEYVVLHELSHFKHPNHSKNFYQFIEKFMIDWKIRKNLLNREFLLL